MSVEGAGGGEAPGTMASNQIGAPGAVSDSCPGQAGGAESSLMWPQGPGLPWTSAPRRVRGDREGRAPLSAPGLGDGGRAAAPLLLRAVSAQGRLLPTAAPDSVLRGDFLLLLGAVALGLAPDSFLFIPRALLSLIYAFVLKMNTWFFLTIPTREGRVSGGQESFPALAAAALCVFGGSLPAVSSGSTP